MNAPSRGSRLRQWGGFVGGAVGLAAFTIWLVIEFSEGDLDRGDKLASIVSMSVTVVTLPLSVIAIVVSLRQAHDPPSRMVGIRMADRLDAVADTLALSVRAQWMAEERVRRIHDPFPLLVQWTNAADQLMDHWQSINGASNRRNPIPLDGDGDHLMETFDRIPSGRLVVLGRAGAGKTMLASRFVLALLADRSSVAGRPVPVIVTLGSWDPKASSLRDWLVGRLIALYPVLAERDDTDATVAEQLLVTGHVMPVLDGFDEIPEGLRADAIVGINASLRTGDRLLLTSRPAEYAAAVAAGDVLTAAAVVCLKNLTADDVRSYLPLTTRRSGTNVTTTKWDPVLDHAYTSPDYPVIGQVLSTPLMVALARTVFSDTNADPTELLESTSAAELEDRLLAGLIPAVYSDIHHDNPPCSDREAHRYLSFLASHLRRLGTYDLAWWQLATTAVSRIAIGLMSGFLMMLLVGIGVGLLGVLGDWSADGRTVWLAAGAVTAVSWGVAGSIIVGVGLHKEHLSPARMQMRMLGRLGHLLEFGLRTWRSLIWILVWSGNGMIFGFVASRLLGSEAGIAVGFAAGLLAGICVRLIGAVVHALTEPVELTKTISPAELIDTDRATALHQGLITGIGKATVLWLAIWLTFEPLYQLPFGEVFPSGVWLLGWLASACIGALHWVLLTTVWGPWLVARTWLSLTGRLPWSIMAFLADAHRRGVLRQAGGVYQFRHARLQDHLALQGAHGDRRQLLPAGRAA
jgi:hypothetical protein